MVYSTGCHTVFYQRHHIVRATDYRFAVMRGELLLRIREIIRQACSELCIEILKGMLSKDHVHMFIAVPPQHSITEVMRCIKGWPSRKIQQEFPTIRKRYWRRHVWQRGYLSTTAGNITQDLMLQYLEQHTEPTGVSR